MSARGTWGRQHFPCFHSKFVQSFGKGRPSKPKPALNIISVDTWSPETAELARSWLKDCFSNHDACARSISHTSTRILPRRIIKVENDSAQGLRARLMLSGSLTPDFQYLTLSHCWGTLKFTTLTRGNYDGFFQQIPVSDRTFNKTFRDAFNITLDLGYDYIWIDSLCIIQDSPGAADWNAECPQVGHIYANGVCNLSATGFADGPHGMINERNAQLLSPCPVKIPFYPVKYIVPNTSPFADEKMDHPLTSRGWVVQEHSLSLSTLHFEKTQTDMLAPSGSWASSSRPLQDTFYYRQWSRHQSRCLARVVEVDTTPAGTNQFGALIDGYLRLRGPALPQITSIDKSLIVSTDLPGGISMRFGIKFDGEVWSPSGKNQRKERFRPWLQSLCWLVLWADSGVAGLVLEQVETRSDGAFRRVGTFKQRGDPKQFDPPDGRVISPVSNLPTQEYLII
ncbi:HET-domain-containing protein [Apiospora saccharicola]|uniref:HET-domain-containing protein n=1 Tax=Apiospora saccharicola TaxID=335842 RepID=A0ABR1VK71_9PEZI